MSNLANSIETTSDGGWLLKTGDVRVKASDPEEDKGGIRAVVAIYRGDDEAPLHRDRVLLTTDRERKRYLSRLEEAGADVELNPRHLLALEDTIRRDPEAKSVDEGGNAWEDPEPWPETVNGAELLNDLTGWYGDHLYLNKHALRAGALWTAATWFVSRVYFAPPLILQSPTKRAGKTLFLDLLRWPVRRGEPTSGIGVTPATLYRMNEAGKPTVLVDEAEKLGGSEADKALIGLLNSGYRRGAKVTRCVGDDHEPMRFDAFGFRALAAIGPLWDTIEDRGIIVPLQRKPKDAHVRRFNSRSVERKGKEFARRLARFAADNADAVARAEEQAPRPKALDDRSCDSWAPLFAVAEVAGGEWPERALNAAKHLSATGHDEDRNEKMIHDLRTVFEDAGNPEAIKSGDVVDELNHIETSPWGDYRSGDGISTHKLSRVLRPFGVEPKQARTSDGTKVRGYWYEDLKPVFERYPPKTPPDEVGQVGQGQNHAGPEGTRSGTRNDPCPSSRSAESSWESRDVPDVPVQERGDEDTHPPTPEGFTDLTAKSLEMMERNPEGFPPGSLALPTEA